MFNRSALLKIGDVAPIGWHLLYFRAYEMLSKDLASDGYENWRIEFALSSVSDLAFQMRHRHRSRI